MNKSVFKKILFYIFIIICFYLYFTLLINNNINELFVNSINSKYNFKSFNIKNKLFNNSLSNYVTFSNNTTNVNKVIQVEEKIENKEFNPIVYIYNTHESEKYHNPFISDYSISPDVRLASFILKDYLNDYGIDSFVQTKSIKEYLDKNKLDYTGSYEASRKYMIDEFKKYNFKILIDIHRDSAKYKYTLYKKDNINYAKIMFVLAAKNKKYKENEEFINNINNRLNKDYKGISRATLIRRDVIFNQDMSKNAVLIELGGVDNTLEEINNTLKVLAGVLNDYIKEEL